MKINLLKHILLYSIFHNIYTKTNLYGRRKLYYTNNGLKIDTSKLKQINIYSLSSFNITIAGFFIMKNPTTK